MTHTVLFCIVHAALVEYFLVYMYELFVVLSVFMVIVPVPIGFSMCKVRRNRNIHGYLELGTLLSIYTHTCSVGSQDGRVFVYFW